jgi:hypothetical protein
MQQAVGAVIVDCKRLDDACVALFVSLPFPPSTMYATLLDRRLTSSSKQAMYLNLLFRTMKADPNPAR